MKYLITLLMVVMLVAPMSADNLWVLEYRAADSADMVIGADSLSDGGGDQITTTKAESLFTTAQINAMTAPLRLRLWYDGVAYTATYRIVDIPEVSGGSAGSDTITIFCVDTSGADAAIEEVKVTVRSLGGTDHDGGLTSSSGTFTFYGTATDTFLITARKLNYVWAGILDAPADSLSQMIFTGNHVDTLAGYNISLGSAPSDADNTMIWTQVYNPFLEPIKGARLVIGLSKDNVYDTCHNILISGETKTVRTDDTGYVQIEVINPKCYDTDVTIKGGVYTQNNRLLYEFEFELHPDSSTYRINPND